MTDFDDLMHAFLSNPAEETPRLMLADWCQENPAKDRTGLEHFLRAQHPDDCPSVLHTRLDFFLRNRPLFRALQPDDIHVTDRTPVNHGTQYLWFFHILASGDTYYNDHQPHLPSSFYHLCHHAARLLPGRQFVAPNTWFSEADALAHLSRIVMLDLQQTTLSHPSDTLRKAQKP